MDTIGKKLGLKEKMAYGCGDAASNIWSYVKKKYKLNTTNFLFLCNC